MTPATERTPFPITAAQREKGHLDSKGAKDIALLQDLGRTTTPSTMNSQLLKNDVSVIGYLSELLALAFADDATFAEVFPDTLMRDPCSTVNDTCLPGLRQDAAGEWNRISPDDATPTERRDYIRRWLIVDAAKHILGFANRPVTDQIAVMAPRMLQSVHCLINVATDVCKTFDPVFTEQFAQPSLADAMTLTPSYATV